MQMPMKVELEHLGEITYDLAGPAVDWAGHRVPTEIAVRFHGASHEPVLEMLLGIVDGVPGCREIHLTAKAGEQGITPGHLSGIRLNEWIEDLFAVAALQVADDGKGTRTVSVPDVDAAVNAVREARRGGRRGIRESQLAELAEVYLGAQRAPTQTVADHFGVSHRTAFNYIQKAEKAGLLVGAGKGKRMVRP